MHDELCALCPNELPQRHGNLLLFFYCYQPECKQRVIAISLCVCVCVLPRNLGECFASLLVEPIAGKNVSPSDEQKWRFSKNILVVES